MFEIHGEYFYGNKISDYGLQYNRVDYATLAKAFDAVLNNDIMNKTWEICEWEQVSGFIDNSEEIEELQEKISGLEEQLKNLPEDDYETYDEIQEKISELEYEFQDLENDQNYFPEVFQWYIVSDEGAKILEEIDEIVYYNYELDMYLWGVTHYGTSWSYVLTDIPCNVGKKVLHEKLDKVENGDDELPF